LILPGYTTCTITSIPRKMLKIVTKPLNNHIHVDINTGIVKYCAENSITVEVRNARMSEFGNANSL
jgi:hypothetical protein